MNLQAEKIELVKMLLDTEDKTLIRDIRSLFKTREKDFYTELPQHGKDGIEKSRRQVSEGKISPLTDVINRLGNR